MIIITNIYKPNENTKQTVDSFEKFGYEVAVLNNPFQGNGKVLLDLYECFKRAATGHELFCYTDGADTYCQRKFEVPKDYILFSVEKHCYPHTWVAEKYPKVKSKWKYLNGGNYGGPLELIIDFFERYGLNKLDYAATGQHEYMLAYLEAIKDKFPIKLDTGCEVFQSMAFEEEGDFKVVRKKVNNLVTKTVPAVLHFNGLTEMSVLKKLQ